MSNQRNFSTNPLCHLLPQGILPKKKKKTGACVAKESAISLADLLTCLKPTVMEEGKNWTSVFCYSLHSCLCHLHLKIGDSDVTLWTVRTPDSFTKSSSSFAWNQHWTLSQTAILCASRLHCKYLLTSSGFEGSGIHLVGAWGLGLIPVGSK